MKKRLLGTAIVIIMVLVFGAIVVGGNSEDSNDQKPENILDMKVSQTTPIVLNINEGRFELSELLKMSDMVAEVKITKEKERGVKHFEVHGEPGFQGAPKTKIDAHIIVFEAEIIEFVKGEQETKKIDLIIPNVDCQSLVSITVDNTYFLYLGKNSNYGDNAYSLIHFRQGTLKINDSQEVLIDNELVKLEEIKEKLLDMKMD